MGRKAAAVALVALMTAACGADEVVAPPEQDEIVGTWVSAGTHVAPGLAAFNVDSLRVTFNANATYQLQQYADGQSIPVVLSGTYQVGAGETGSIRGITVNQTEGSVTAIGIFRVTGSGMTYEIIQTAPEIPGITPPTETAGFGSSAYFGTSLGQYWVQTYVKR
jgi:hypothetical protein